VVFLGVGFGVSGSLPAHEDYVSQLYAWLGGACWGVEPAM